MKEKLEVCLLRPRFIAKYLGEKLNVSVLFALFFILLSTILYSVRVYELSKTPIDSYTDRALFNNIKNSNKDFTISNSGLTTDDSFVIQGSSVVLYFNQEVVFNPLDTRSIFSFNEAGIDSYYLGAMLFTYEYNDIIKQDINIKNVGLKDVIDTANFTNLINTINDDLNMIIVPSISIANFFQRIFSYGMILCFIIILTSNKGILLPFKLRLKMTIYSTVIYLVLDYFSVVFAQDILTTLGMILAYVYTSKALSSIKVEIRKK